VLTGDEEFVRIARLAAARLGMYLDEYGLWRWHSSEEAALESQSQFQVQSNPDTSAQHRPQNGGYWELVEGESEDRILDEIELGVIAPHRRNFGFLTSKKRASARAGTLDFSLAEEYLAEEGERGRKR
jgi:DNA polymerase beta